MKKILLAISAVAAAWVIDPIPSAQAAYMQLNSVSPASAHAGATVQLHGNKFGATQAGHRLLLNKGLVLRALTVVSWSNTQITAVVPAGLEPGAYEVWIGIPIGATGPVNASGTAPLTILPSVKPELGKAIRPPGVGAPGLQPKIKQK